jgi:hypothetical protein
VVGQHPLPPNTYTVELTINDGTVLYNDAFWAERCKQVPSTAPYVVVMGAVIDYFRPNGEEISWCDMLTSHRKQEWSKDGLSWQKPAYTCTGFMFTANNGGSAVDWPKENVEGDARGHLSIWGNDRIDVMGGCCSSSYTEYNTFPNNNGDHWRQPFSMAYGAIITVAYMEQLIAAAVAAEKAIASTAAIAATQKQLPPFTTTVELAVNDGTALFNDVFWAERCKQVPPTAPYVVVVMGAVIDFFRPINGTSWCDVLMSDRKHQWSSNGVDWQAPEYWLDGYGLALDVATHIGGSYSGWPKNENNVEVRFSSF